MHPEQLLTRIDLAGLPLYGTVSRTCMLQVSLQRYLGVRYMTMQIGSKLLLHYGD